MTTRLLAVLIVIFSLVSMAEGGESVHKKLVIGTKEAPPFSMKDENGNWTGISIELWKSIAADMGLEYEFQERDLKGLLQGLQDGSLDGSVAALTITDQREQLIDFTHPFHTSGLGIAVKSNQEADATLILKNIFTSGFLRAFGLLFMTLFIAGFLIWIFEAKNDKFGFGATGLFNSLYWSTTTHTTVGYGDLIPQTIPGRIIAMIWMVISVIIIATLTGRISSAMTAAELQAGIHTPEDLVYAKVGTVKNSTSYDHVVERGVKSVTAYSALTPAMQDMVDGKLDAVVYDTPLLQYVAKYSDGRVKVLPNVLVRQDYGIGLPSGSDLREPLNCYILKKTRSGDWKKITSKYLGG